MYQPLNFTYRYKIIISCLLIIVKVLCSVHRETNLKCRQPLTETAELGDDEDKLSTVKSIDFFSCNLHAKIV